MLTFQISFGGFTKAASSFLDVTPARLPGQGAALQIPGPLQGRWHHWPPSQARSTEGHGKMTGAVLLMRWGWGVPFGLSSGTCWSQTVSWWRARNTFNGSYREGGPIYFPNGFMEQNAQGPVAERKPILGRKPLRPSKGVGEGPGSGCFPNGARKYFSSRYAGLNKNPNCFSKIKGFIGLLGVTIAKSQCWTNGFGTCPFDRYVFNFSDKFFKKICILSRFFFKFFKTCPVFWMSSQSKDIESKMYFKPPR